MNVLFLTMVEINSLSERGIYTDLLRKFQYEGHNLYIICPIERREKGKTHIYNEKNCEILKINTLNLQKSNLIEKGVGILLFEFQILYSIKKYYPTTKFDLILYSTPPISLSRVINFVKKRDRAFSYLLLKDIFPQNAVDMKMMKANSLFHKYFVRKEKKLYKLSDHIGCMSQANVDFLLNHNLYLNASKVEINPNSIDPKVISLTDSKKIRIREKYLLPIDKKIFIYAGNLGKPQGVDFLLTTISECTNKNAFFLIIGDGTEFDKINNWLLKLKPINAKIFKRLPKQDFDYLLAACDVGMIYLHPDFLIPNFPSRLLSYLEMKKPVIAATDCNTDIGDIIENAKCGYKVISGDITKMNYIISKFIESGDSEKLGINAWNLLIKNYTVDKSYNLIFSKFEMYKSNH